MIIFKYIKPAVIGAISLQLLCMTAPLKAADFTVQDGITLTNQNVTLSTGETGIILFGGTITDPDDAITASGNVTIDNAGTVISTGGAGDDGILHTGGMLTLINRATGTITGDDGVLAATITSLNNLGTITATQSGVFAFGTIESFINSGTIDAGANGVLVFNSITSLINSGTITGGTADGVNVQSVSLINSGTITGGDDGVEAVSNISLINSGTITGADDGIRANTITSLINSGTITGNGDRGGGSGYFNHEPYKLGHHHWC